MANPYVSLGGGYDADMMRLARQRQMAELLQQQAQEPLQANFGDAPAPISWGSVLAKGLQAYSANKKMADADEQEKKLSSTRNEQLAKLLVPEDYKDAGGGGITAHLPGGITATAPNIQDANTDKRTQIADMLAGGLVDPETLAPLALKNIGLGGTQAPIKLGKDDRLLDPTTYKEVVGALPPPAEKINYNQPFLPDGKPNLEYQKYQENLRAKGAPQTNVNVNTDKTFASGIAGNLANQFTGDREKAQSAAAGIEALQEARTLLDQGIYTGQLADMQLLAGKLGISDPSKIANTEAFQAAMGRQTLALVKNLGAGSGISNADREYADKVAGGKITLNEDSLRKIIDINERAQRGVIKKYNQQAERVSKAPSLAGLPIDMMVPEPAQAAPKAAPQGNIPTVNTPEEARKLPRGTRFRTPDGAIRVVP